MPIDITKPHAKGPQEGDKSPWGKIDHVSEVAPGIWSVGTPGHGGFKLSRARNARMPSAFRKAGGWYEEDCEWGMVAIVFSEPFNTEQYYAAHAVIRNYYPDEYTQVTGVTVQLEESSVLRRRQFEIDHANDWIVIAASGDWKAGTPKGYVYCVATLGGKRSRFVKCINGSEALLSEKERFFFVPDAEYSKRAEFGFVIDLAKHLELSEELA